MRYSLRINKLNEINFDLLSDKELIMICLKYKIIQKEDISKTTRKELLNIIKSFLLDSNRFAMFNNITPKT